MCEIVCDILFVFLLQAPDVMLADLDDRLIIDHAKFEFSQT